MGRVLRFALVLGAFLIVVVGALPLSACHEAFDDPGKPDLAKTPLNFGFDLAGADLSVPEADQDMSSPHPDLAHPDLSKLEGDAGN